MNAIAMAMARRRHLVVTAHPDDETISFGGMLSQLADVRVLQLTTGADAQETAGAALRRQEREAAFAAAGWPWAVTDCGVPGRQAHEHLETLLAVVSAAVAQADVVWTHPYEGGHIDHDTAAWLVQQACLGRSTLRMEFASYHTNRLRQTFGDFWPDEDSPTVVIPLTGDALTRKQAAMAEYVSQAAILRKFPAPEMEAYRVAPTYDFRKPPAPPRCRWDVKGYRPTTETWRQAVARAA